jgi:hypothetical protein
MPHDPRQPTTFQVRCHSCGADVAAGGDGGDQRADRAQRGAGQGGDVPAVDELRRIAAAAAGRRYTSHVRAMCGHVIAGVVGAVSVAHDRRRQAMPFIHSPEGVEAQQLAVWLAR